MRDLDGDGAPEIIASGNHVDELPTFSILPNPVTVRGRRSGPADLAGGQEPDW
ncbi:MAG TPA: hypothetical protein VGQ65_23505 [Thermoanaerobaculia bacterium]|nr:hypothetical protein [Thermoanaerobaculia bacterium]